MEKYSLVHLTDLSCPPPELVRIAANAGYDCVSLRTIPMRVAGETPYDLARDKALFRQTKEALEETGILLHDIENARIVKGVQIADYESALEAAALLGSRHVLTNIWTDDKTYYIDKFCQLCELAREYTQVVNIEFVTWASVADLADAKAILDEAGCDNAGIIVDALHFYRSRVKLEELDLISPTRFHYLHICDAPKEIPTDEESLVHTGRAERLYPGDGAIDLRAIVSKIPHAVRGVEIPHLKRLKEIPLEEHARIALEKTKACIGDIA